MTIDASVSEGATDSFETTLSIKGMTCGSCVRRVDRAVRAVDGVRDVRIDLATGRAVVAHDASDDVGKELAAAVERAGYGVTVDAGSLG